MVCGLGAWRLKSGLKGLCVWADVVCTEHDIFFLILTLMIFNIRVLKGLITWSNTQLFYEEQTTTELTYEHVHLRAHDIHHISPSRASYGASIVCTLE